MTSVAAPAVRLTEICKNFGTVRANRDVSLEVAPGTIHGIIGENGAGKSTLVSILYGFYAADSGQIEIDGRVARIETSADAIRLGIGMVHQHFMLVPTFTVLENVMLGAEGGLMLKDGIAATRAELERLSREHGLEIDPDAVVGDLAVGLQQRVEILKALRRGARILILDEPTGVLTPDETDRLFAILRALKRDGVTILLITHKLREIMEVTDAVSVMRRGEMVGHRTPATTTREELAELMVGRKVLLEAQSVAAEPGPVALAAEGLSWRDAAGVLRLDGVSLELRAGEILGVAGVTGNGQSELLDLLSGIAAPQQGRIRLGGREIGRGHPADPAEMRRLGLAHVPEDRQHRGLVLEFDAAENAVLGYHRGPRAGPGRLISPAAMRALCQRLMERFDVRPTVLLVGQPTRGVDIGAIEFINQQLIDLKRAGCAILLVS
ncbi:MAG: ABC transporter ATP-binding protein, partial [Alphaproteobacteria bacterium]